MSKASKLVRMLPQGLRRAVAARHISAATNVYHCCVHKTASQWLRKIFADERTYQYSGLNVYNYERELPGKADPRPLTDRTFDQPFLEETIVTPIYIDLPCFERVPKPEAFRAFFVPRDPRDIVVSWYFSVKVSHKVMNKIGDVRSTLQTMSEEDGLRHAIDCIASEGLFEALRSWRADAVKDPRLRVFRYEDLIGSAQFNTWRQLMDHCDIAVPDDVLRALLEEYSFRALTQGRERGAEDVNAHLRKGVEGDWKNHFTPAVEKKFREVTGPLVEQLGYSEALA